MGHGKYFGSEGAGILVYARDTGRFLAVKRSDNVLQPRTWGIPGGKLEEGETPEEGARRELREEIKYQGQDVDLIPLTPFRDEARGFRFNNFLAVVDHEFVPDLDRESADFTWVNSLDDWPKPPHFGVDFIRTDEDSRRIIQAEMDAAEYPGRAHMRELMPYPVPENILYHCIPVAAEGDAIRASTGYGSAIPEVVRNKLGLPGADKTPLVFASNFASKALAFAFDGHSGEAVFNMALEGGDVELILVGDRAQTMSRPRHAALYSFSGDNFVQLCDRQFVSKDPVPFADTRKVMDIKSAEDLMRAGLQIFSLNEHAPDLWDDAAFKTELFDSGGPVAGLKAMMQTGRVIWENQARGINPSPVMQWYLDHATSTPPGVQAAPKPGDTAPKQ